MVFNTEKGKVTDTNLESERFQIQADEKLFMLLSDSVYADKIAAGIRELSCNAYDAHVESRNPEEFEVTLPTQENPIFKVRDFGKGLSPEQMSMYTTYGSSSKEGSNAYIGAFGIGAKSPFAYTDTFNVTSYYQGKAYFYVMMIERGLPKKTLLAVTDTDEPSGLEVSYTVKQDDVNEFQTKGIKILVWMKEKVCLVNEDALSFSFNSIPEIDWTPSPYLGENFAELNLEVENSRYESSELRIVQGNVAYNISQDELREAFKAFLYTEDTTESFIVKESLSDSCVSFTGTLKVPNGTFMPQPSRERLSFTPETKEKLGSILCLIYKEKVSDKIQSMIDKADESYMNLFKVWVNSRRILKDNKKFVSLKFPDYEQTFSRWIHTGVSNLREFIFNYETGRTTMNTIKKFMEVRYVINDGFPLYRMPSGKFLSLEKRCRIIEDMHHKGNLMQKVYILCEDTTKFLSEKDLQSIPSVDELFPSSEATKEHWKGTSVKAGTYTIVYYGNGDTSRVTKFISDNPSEKELKYTFWIPADKAYQFSMFGKAFDLSYRNGKREFAERFSRFVKYYLKKKHIEDEEPIYANPCIVLLPEGHPYTAKLKKFSDIVVEGAEYYISQYESNVGWHLRYRDEDFVPLVIGLIQNGFLRKLKFSKEVVKKYSAWEKSGFQCCEKIPEFEDCSHVPLSKEFKDKNDRLVGTFQLENFLLEIEKEILVPIQNEFPLINAVLCNYYRVSFTEELISEIVNYLNFKLESKED